MSRYVELIRDPEYSWVYERGEGYVIRPSISHVRRELCRNDKFGPLFQTQVDWNDQIERKFQESGLVNLYLYRSLQTFDVRPSKYEVGFLRRLPKLACLQILPYVEDLEPIYLLQNLKSLSGVDELGERFDWGRMPNIESCDFGWGSMAHTIANNQKLKEFGTWSTGYKIDNLGNVLSQLINLESLSLLDFASLKTLSFLSKMPRLRCLYLTCLNKLEEFWPLRDCQELNTIAIYCSKFNDLTDVAQCPKLESLMLGGKGVDSVKPLANHPTLRFIGVEERTSILDGDLYPLETIPNLEHVNIRMPNRRHYSHHFDRDTGAMIPKPDWKPI